MLPLQKPSRDERERGPPLLVKAGKGRSSIGAVGLCRQRRREQVLSAKETSARDNESAVVVVRGETDGERERLRENQWSHY